MLEWSEQVYLFVRARIKNRPISGISPKRDAPNSKCTTQGSKAYYCSESSLWNSKFRVVAVVASVVSEAFIIVTLRATFCLHCSPSVYIHNDMYRASFAKLFLLHDNYMTPVASNNKFLTSCTILSTFWPPNSQRRWDCWLRVAFRRIP